MTTEARLPQIDGIEIIDVIARGGQSTVYRGRWREQGRPVAVKVHDGLPADDARRRFERERTALEVISDHPAIISLLGSATTAEGQPALVLELADGGSLEDRLADGPLGVDEATALTITLASALDRAHQAGVVHRDIKPANIVRTVDGRWKLTDFGVAAIDEGPATTTLQVSFGHAPPEAFDQTLPTPAGDVYSLASTLLTSLTGEMPFGRREHETMAATVHRLAVDDLPSLRELGVPAPLAAIIEAGMSKRPADRPPSAWFFGRAVESVRRELGLAPATAPTPDETVIVQWAQPDEPSSARPTSRPRRSRRILTAAAATIVMLLGLGGWALSTSDPATMEAASIEPAITTPTVTTPTITTPAVTPTDPATAPFTDLDDGDDEDPTPFTALDDGDDDSEGDGATRPAQRPGGPGNGRPGGGPGGGAGGGGPAGGPGGP